VDRADDRVGARRRGRLPARPLAARRGPLYSEAFGAGAVLTMLADSMMPEAFEHGGKSVGLLVVQGYLVAAALTVLQ